jgi:predicted dehydrogenase
VIGAGAFARSTLLPVLQAQVDIAGVANATGASAKATAAQFGASMATTDVDQLLGDERIDAVVIATRHDTHSEYVARALDAGKHVFVEKPLALNETELDEVERAAARSDRVLMVGFNRRYAPLALELRNALGGHGPLMVSYRVNAGRLPASHWTHDPHVGGGRIVGEMCHFVDFASFIADAPPVDVVAATVNGSSEPREDNVSSILQLADGSVAAILYASLGDPSMTKERVEILGEAGAGVLDDFRQLSLHRAGSARTKSGKRDKGHAAEMAAFVRACRRGEAPQSIADLAAVTRATFTIRERIQQSLASEDPAIRST